MHTETQTITDMHAHIHKHTLPTHRHLGCVCVWVVCVCVFVHVCMHICDCLCLCQTPPPPPTPPLTPTPPPYTQNQTNPTWSGPRLQRKMMRDDVLRLGSLLQGCPWSYVNTTSLRAELYTGGDLAWPRLYGVTNNTRKCHMRQFSSPGGTHTAEVSEGRGIFEV